MKRAFLAIIGLGSLTTWTACSNQTGTGSSAVDLETGRTITLVKDTASGQMVDADTRKPVSLYVDKSSKDTIYGPTGEVVNNKVQHTSDGKYVYFGAVSPNSGNNEFSAENENVKVKAEDGEYKVKGDDYKKKVDEDGDIKIKEGDRKVKVDGETGEVKVK